jgi:hypothetical protein
VKQIAALVLAGLLLSGFALAPALGIEVQGRTLLMSDEEAQACIDGGGCAFVTRAAIAAAMTEAYRRGALVCRNML